MSAIGGILDTVNPVSISEVSAMSDTVRNIRSDYCGEWNSTLVGLFSKLLRTTPESQYETLPLYDKESHCVLTADARIDNRYDLMDDLEIEVDKSKPLTDGELILESYLKWGEECVSHLIGDFSFAIWDKINEKLFCARDHLGIRPFYYFHNAHRFVFSSTMESVIVGAKIAKKPMCKVVQEILNNDIKNHTNTIFQNVFRLLPGHTLVIEKGDICIRRYWFPETISINSKLSLQDATEGFTSVMKQAISTRMRSSYNIGCELSGGLDSSTILTLAHGVPLEQTLYAFASVYGDLSCDESTYIHDIAKKLDINPIYSHADQINYEKYNLKFFYSISKEWPGKGSFLDIFDELELAQSRNVRVILTGQGGDQLAAGFNDMLTDYLVQGNFIRLFRTMIHHGWSKQIIKRHLILPFIPHKILNFLKLILGRVPSSFPSSFTLDPGTSFLTFSQKKELEVLYSPASLLWLESNPYLQTSEHYQIEFRHPFFDKRVVEYMLSLPAHYKYDGKIRKIIIREAMKNSFPDSILNRQDKAEFTPIVEKQMKKINKESKVRYNTKYCTMLNKKLRTINDKWNNICLHEWFDANFN